MTFSDYQQEARKTANYPTIGHSIIYPALGLTGEAGEFSDKIKKIFRDKGGVISPEDKVSLMKELGDVLWYIHANCDELGVTMDEVAAMNIMKLNSRQERGTIGGSGDER